MSTHLTPDSPPPRQPSSLYGTRAEAKLTSFSALTTKHSAPLSADVRRVASTIKGIEGPKSSFLGGDLESIPRTVSEVSSIPLSKQHSVPPATVSTRFEAETPLADSSHRIAANAPTPRPNAAAAVRSFEGLKARLADLKDGVVKTDSILCEVQQEIKRQPKALTVAAVPADFPPSYAPISERIPALAANVAALRQLANDAAAIRYEAELQNQMPQLLRQKLRTYRETHIIAHADDDTKFTIAAQPHRWQELLARSQKADSQPAQLKIAVDAMWHHALELEEQAGRKAAPAAQRPPQLVIGYRPQKYVEDHEPAYQSPKRIADRRGGAADSTPADQRQHRLADPAATRIQHEKSSKVRAEPPTTSQQPSQQQFTGVVTSPRANVVPTTANGVTKPEVSAVKVPSNPKSDLVATPLAWKPSTPPPPKEPASLPKPTDAAAEQQKQPQSLWTQTTQPMVQSGTPSQPAPTSSNAFGFLGAFPKPATPEPQPQVNPTTEPPAWKVPPPAAGGFSFTPVPALQVTPPAQPPVKPEKKEEKTSSEAGVVVGP